MQRSIPYGRQNISDEDVQAVVDVLKSDWLTQGPAIERFEQTVAAYCGVKYAIAVNSATSALHIACLAAGLGEGDVLWTSPNSFVASANCGRYCGADVDFVDIDMKTYNMSVQALEHKLRVAEQNGKMPKILVPVHFAGQSCEMAEIRALAKKYDITIVEDASHAIGGTYQEGKIGSCMHSDMVVFSFHPVKVITTAEGGMVLTNQKSLYDKLVLLRSHGITRDSSLMTEALHGPWYYQQIELGYNYRITDIQAALGYSQMTRLDDFVQRRHKLAERYDTLLKDLPIIAPWQHPDNYSAYHLYVIRLKLGEFKQTHREVFERLRAANIGVNLHYIPIHTHPYYQKLGFARGQFPNVEQYYQEAISLPMFYDLTEDEQDYVIATLREILG